MSEKLKQPDEPQILNPDEFLEGVHKLEPTEQVVIQSDFSNVSTITIKGPDNYDRDPIEYDRVVGVCIGDVDSGDRNKFDQFEVLRYRVGGSYAIRSINHSSAESIPVPLFKLGEGSGILGRTGRPYRDSKLAFVKPEHVQITSEGDKVMFKNLEPHYQTVLYRI